MEKITRLDKMDRTNSFLLKINTSVTIDSRDLWKVEHRVTRNARCIGRVNDRFHKRSAELCYVRSGSLTA